MKSFEIDKFAHKLNPLIEGSHETTLLNCEEVLELISEFMLSNEENSMDDNRSIGLLIKTVHNAMKFSSEYNQ